MSHPSEIEICGYKHVIYNGEQYPEQELIPRSQAYYEWLDKRRSVREFTDQPVPKEVIDNLILSGSTAPSGAHKQPWTFCAISNPTLKSKIRIAAEIEEKKAMKTV